MTVSEALARVDTLCPNARSTAEKLAWLSGLDGQVNEFLKDYEGYTDTAALPYREGDMGRELLIPFPYEDVYVHYLHAQISYAMGEFSRYENALVQFNTLMQSYRIAYHKAHMPRQVRKRVL